MALFNEKNIWKVIEAYSKENSLVLNQIDTFNDFIHFGLQEIIDQESEINFPNYKIKFGQISLSKPQLIEEDRSVKLIYPMDARTRDLNYDSAICCDITEIYIDDETKQNDIKEYKRIVIGRMPIMVKSTVCNLYNLSESEIIDKGECENDVGGYFIIKGNERVLAAQMRAVYNHVFVLRQKTTEKYKWIAETRSMSDETGHSVLIEAMIGNDDRTILFSLPYIKKPINAGIVLKALGYTNESDIVKIIGLNSDRANKYIRYILRDSFFCQTKEEALAYIGKFSLHVISADKQFDYAKQVIENEILPHLGVSAKPIEQACFLGKMLKKLITTHIGERSEDDRDNLANKRVDTAGMLMYDIFRNLFKKFVQFIKLKLEKRKQRPDIISIISGIKNISQGLHKCLATGNWGVQKNSSYVRSGVSQVLDRMTYCATLSHLRRVIIPMGKDGKNAAMRQIHSSSFGFICPCECFDPNTEILLWSGQLKKASEIKVGDYLINDNGDKTMVKSICSGINRMFEIKHLNKDFKDYTVTDNHILTLKATFHGKMFLNNHKFYVYSFDKKILDYVCNIFENENDAIIYQNQIIKDSIIDISIENYKNVNSSVKQTLKMFKSKCINWPYQKVDHDPFYIGELLRKENDKKREQLFNSFSISKDYLINSENVRRQILAGLIDNNGKIYISERTLKDIDFLICSLGFSFSIKKEKDFLEVILNFQDNYSEFQLVEKPINKFVGWQLNGNGRFVLSDFTVTHNTPEGQKIGVVLNYALMTKITKRISKVNVKNILEKCKTIIHANSMEINNISNKTVIFLNGGIVGFTNDPEDTIEEIKKFRNKGLIPNEVSISYDIVDDDINVFCDEGRFTRPLFTLNENKLNIPAENKYIWSDLIKKGYVTYVDPSEIENSVIAMNLDILQKQKNDFCEIHPSTMLGIMASMIPFPDHSQSPRNCYQCLWKEEKVLLSSGEFKRIADIVIGDIVITVDPVSLKTASTKVINHYVKSTNKKIVEVRTISERKVVCTVDHPIMTQSGWKEAGNLNLDDKIAILNNIDNEWLRCKGLLFSEFEKVTSLKGDFLFVPIKSVNQKPNVIIADITTESESHSFITGNLICVHNSSMGKQALGMPILSHNIRSDTLLHVLHYPQKPLVKTKVSDIFNINEMPSGINAIVAIACYSGFNQEDSVMLNLSSIQRGLFCLSSYHTIDCFEKKRDTYSFEEICVPPQNSDPSIKQGEFGYFRRKNANYSLLDENGIIRQRERFENGKWVGAATVVKKGDVLVGKIIVSGNKISQDNKIDASLVVQPGEEGIIDRVFSTITPNGYRLVKIVIRVTREPTLGDKLASRSAQKGTIGMVYRQEDMPFSLSSHITPDIVINPLCIPSRMTINQLIETALGKECAVFGNFADCTPFTENSVNAADKLVDRLSENITKYGFQSQGWETMCNGMTGEMMKSRIFMGPTYYQRLKHMVADKMHARAQGHVTMLTRQPTEGRSKDGGLRFGEMERDCMIGHGNSAILRERLFQVSDPFQVSVCDICGNITEKVNYCQKCKKQSVSICNIPYASKLLYQELTAMGIKASLTPDKY